MELAFAIVAFLIAVMILAEAFSLIGNAVGNGGDFRLIVIEETSIWINVLGAIALGFGTFTSIVILVRRIVAMRGWIVLEGLLLAFLIIHPWVKVTGGELDIPREVQFGAMVVAFAAFWLGFYGDEREIGLQSYVVFSALTVLYWGVDLSGIPSVISSGAPTTTFAGGGLSDSVIVYPLSSAIAYYLATKIGRIVSRLQRASR